MIHNCKRKLWGGIIGMLLAVTAGAQSLRCDSLQFLLSQNPQADTMRMVLLYQLAGEKRYSDTKAAEELIGAGYAIAVALDNKWGIVEGLGQKAGMNYRKGKFMLADSLYQSALSIAVKQKMKAKVPLLKYDLGILYSRQKRMKEAGVLFEEVLPVFKAAGEWKNVVKCLFNLGRVAASENDVQKAMLYYTDGLRLTEEWKLPKEKALIYSNMGALYFNMKEWEKALECFKKAQPVYEELNDLGLLAGSYQQTGTVYILLKNYEEATAYLLKARDVFQRLGYASQLRHVLVSLGVLAKKQEKFGEALVYYQEIYDDALASRDTNFQIVALVNMGSAYLSSDNVARALEVTRGALALAEPKQEWSALSNAYENMTSIYFRQGKYREAFGWQQKHRMACDSLYNKEKFRQLEELRTKYDLEVKELTIGNLEKQNILQNMTLRRERLIRNGIAGVLLVCLLVVFFFYRQYGRIRTANRNLVMKNKEILEQQEKFTQNLKWVEKEKITEGRYGDTGLSEKTMTEMVSAIEEAFKNEQVYRDSELSLSSLARRLNTNTAYLSRVINEYYGLNFSNFINTYRINAAQRMVLSTEYDHFTIEGIAREVGFKSKSSFNAAFKNITGLTPSAYKKAKS